MDITPDVFKEQCKRRFGRTNPEQMRMAYWEWMIRSMRDPVFIREELGLDELRGSDPDWCFERYGRTRTRMPDGRMICIAGEHEDFYDPDFCIYNDVIVLLPEEDRSDIKMDSCTIEIYGYPESIFPPTDHHSATVVENKIFIIGRLGYAGTRRENDTPIMALDLSNYRIEPVQARGQAPGWIYSHSAWYEPERHAIVIRGGKMWREHANSEIPNDSVHRLHLEDMRWERIAEHEARRHFVIRCNGFIRQDVEWKAFRPTIPHEWIELDDRESPICQFMIDGVRITLDPWSTEIEVVMEGELSAVTRNLILSQLANHLREISDGAWTIEETDETQLRSKRKMNGPS